MTGYLNAKSPSVVGPALKANAEKSEAVKKMGVQLTRIRNDWQQSAAPKDLAPVAKARAAAEVSKSDRISELQVELSQRDAREVHENEPFGREVRAVGRDLDRAIPGVALRRRAADG